MVETGLKTKRRAVILLLSFLLVVLVYNALFSYSYTVGSNYRNVSIDTRVNITNAAPEITSISLNPSITLTAGGTKYVECNVSVRDYNGWQDLNYTESVFYHSTSTSGAADDNNTHYSNASCTRVAQNGNEANYTCGFAVYYYALNGTWTCNATVYDNSSYNGTLENTTTLNQLLALNVSNTFIDFGDLAVGDTSANQSLDVQNFGNVPINVSVQGYGVTSGDNLAFQCDQGTISVDNERFSDNIAADWATKTPLASTYQDVGITIPKQTLSTTPSLDTTYWQLYVPPNPFGQCNGTIIFQASSPT